MDPVQPVQREVDLVDFDLDLVDRAELVHRTSTTIGSHRPQDPVEVGVLDELTLAERADCVSECECRRQSRCTGSSGVVTNPVLQDRPPALGIATMITLRRGRAQFLGHRSEVGEMAGEDTVVRRCRPWQQRNHSARRLDAGEQLPRSPISNGETGADLDERIPVRRHVCSRFQGADRRLVLGQDAQPLVHRTARRVAVRDSFVQQSVRRMGSRAVGGGTGAPGTHSASEESASRLDLAPAEVQLACGHLGDQRFTHPATGDESERDVLTTLGE